MKAFTTLVFFSMTLFALNCTYLPETDDKMNPELSNTLSAVNILDLSGTDCGDNTIQRFRIETLVNPSAGIVYLTNGETPVTVGQYLTLEEANGLRFTPTADFVGDATFTYASVDENNAVDSTPAMVTIPVVANNNCVVPKTDDKMNPELLNSLTAVNILDLSGTDCDENVIQRFRIETLVEPSAGILYLANGETAVTVGQYLNLEEANGLRFTPTADFVGNAIFTYASVDGNDVIDNTPAVVTIPVVDTLSVVKSNTAVGHVHDSNCGCPDYEESISTLSNVTLIFLFLLTVLIGKTFLKRELLS